MIKRTLYFGNPAYLSLKNRQMVIKLPGLESKATSPDKINSEPLKTIPIEDVGVVVLDNPRITITQGLMTALSENSALIMNCDSKHLPFSLLLPSAVHHAYTEKLRFQLKASVPLKKNLWQQTVVAKISNQAHLLERQGVDSSRLLYLAKRVKSGDSENCEGRAAAYYWKMILQVDLRKIKDKIYDKESDSVIENRPFRRQRFGDPPNNLLNYGYAILRGVIARSLVSSGLLCAMGIHHRNKYNPYCLADDIMEPYRPYVDQLVLNLVSQEDNIEELTPDLKRQLLQIPAMDINIDGQKSPLMVGVQRTTASLMHCFEGISKKIIFPVLD